MTVQLVLQKNGETVPIRNLIGIGPEITVHSMGDGEMMFADTTNVRVVGFEDRPGMIFELLERQDVIVMFGDAPIFARPDWGQGSVNRMCEELVAVAEGN